MLNWKEHRRSDNTPLNTKDDPKSREKDELTRRLIVTCPSAWMFSLSRKYVGVVLINKRDICDLRIYL